MSLSGRLVDVGGVRGFVHEIGPAASEPLVLVHGWAMSHFMWRDVIARLVAAGQRVVAVDLPGFGESDRPSPARFDYAPAAQATWLLRLLDTLDVGRVRLVGHSMGGAVGVHAAAHDPERVRELVVVDGALLPPRLPAITALLRVPRLGPAALRTGSRQAIMARFMRQELYADARAVTPELVRYVWERLHRPGGVEAAHAAFLSVLDPAASRAAWDRLRVPARLVWGEHDRLFPLDRVRALGGAGRPLTVITGAGHSPAEEQAAATARAILEAS
jgi:pimeloyl-ACP methyl ester carboxylesterase